jgi:hypothetical protein
MVYSDKPISSKTTYCLSTEMRKAFTPLVRLGPARAASLRRTAEDRKLNGVTDLIATARRLAMASPMRPRQSELKRGASAAYHALYALARDCADLLVGTGDTRSDPAWAQVYRTLEHGVAKNSCQVAASRGFPGSIVSFADTFVIMQEERHDVC